MQKTILKEKIINKSAWLGQDIIEQANWIYHLSETDLVSLNQALKKVQYKGLQAPFFEKKDFLIEDASLLGFIQLLVDELENGLGFFVLKGLSVEKYSENQLAIIYFGLGLYLGSPVSQNAQGDLLGQVENSAEKIQESTRVYQTNAYLPYHTDLSDVVGLLCIRKAKQGGLSSLISVAAVYNQILSDYPEYLSYYYYPTFCAHLDAEQPTLTPIFSYFKQKLSCRYQRAYIELGHKQKGLAISQVEKEALDLFDSLIHDPTLQLDMMLQPGDMQFCNNYQVLHSRTAFEDDSDVAKRRKLLRLWLKMPNARQLSVEFPGRNGIVANNLKKKSI